MKDGSNGTLCPYHVALGHRDLLSSKFAVNGSVPPNLPVFPSVDGLPVKKARVVATFECLAYRCQCPLKDALGRRAFGGHSARVSGARYLSSIGVELLKISILARWQSEVILRYVGDSPLVSLTED